MTLQLPNATTETRFHFFLLSMLKSPMIDPGDITLDALTNFPENPSILLSLSFLRDLPGTPS